MKILALEEKELQEQRRSTEEVLNKKKKTKGEGEISCSGKFGSGKR